MKIKLLTSLIVIISFLSCSIEKNEETTFTGHVYLNDKEVSNALVHILEIDINGVSNVIDSMKTDANGSFVLNNLDDELLYFIRAYPVKDKNIQLLSIYDGHETVAINEKTTIATCAVYAQFIQDGTVQGELKRLNFGKHSVANLVKPSNGNYGEVLLNGENLTESATMAKLNTLGNLLLAVASNETLLQEWKEASLNDSELSTTNGTIDLLAKIFKHSWYKTNEQFSLFEKVYPRGEELRKAPLMPYLEMAPNEFALAVRFSGGGIYSPGKLEMDEYNNIWSGQNWMPGSQSNTLRGIGGGMVKLNSSGKALSPDVTGFVGAKVNGCGWGTAVGNDKVWMSSFNGHVAVFDMNGKELKSNITGKLGNLMGVAISPVNKDVWVCDGTANQMVVFPNGDPEKGVTVQVPNLASPFSIVIDENNDVWIGNSAGYYVTKFNASTPNKSEKYMTNGISVRGLSLDNNGEVWVSNSFNMTTKVPSVDPTLTIMEQFTFLGKFAYENWPPNTKRRVGSLVMLDKNNPTKPQFEIGGEKSELAGPWGNVVDGANDLWAGNFLGTGILNYKTSDDNALGLKKGDLVHRYEMGLFQEVTDVLVDYMGHVWVANNWNDEAAVLGIKNEQYSSTRGGGAGITVIYGAAEPAK